MEQELIYHIQPGRGNKTTEAVNHSKEELNKSKRNN